MSTSIKQIQRSKLVQLFWIVFNFNFINFFFPQRVWNNLRYHLCVHILYDE